MGSTPLLPSPATAGAADSTNRIPQFASFNFGFDQTGQTLLKSNPSGQTQFQWDARGRITQATMANGQTVTYGYDPVGRLASKTINGVTTQFLSAGQDVVADIGPGGTVDYLNGPGVDEKLSQSGVGGPLYFLQDHLGSTVILTSATGGVVEHEKYDSYGKSNAGGFTRFLYTGRELDSATSLYYYRARYYDPIMGRFVSEDPLQFGTGRNFYTYGGSDPLVFTDPSGLRVQIVGDANTVTELQAAYNSVNSTASGKALINALENSPTLYLITNLHDGDSFYDPDTNIISVDPNFHPDVAVDNGKTCSVEQAPTNAILAHEIGHAATGILDDGPGNMNNVTANENPIRKQLGLPLRLSYP